MNNNNSKVWLITGAAKGMGLEVAKTVLANGDKVIGTSRNLKDLIENIGEENENFLPVELEISDEENVKFCIQKSIEKFGKIDVVLNNAGYYLVGSLEEISDAEFRKTVDVNLFGMANVIRNILPHFRTQKGGHIINISSNMGYIGYANTGSYNASKFAVIGLSEALVQEVLPFGIKVTVVAPGMFRTNFMSETTLMVAQHLIPDYHVLEHVEALKSFDGNQPGDPKKLAKVLLQISQMEKPPLHLPLGSDSYQSILAQRNNEQKELAEWEDLSLSTDF